MQYVKNCLNVGQACETVEKILHSAFFPPKIRNLLELLRAAMQARKKFALEFFIYLFIYLFIFDRVEINNE